MGFQRQIHVIDTHTECDPTRLVISGVPYLNGDSMREKRNLFMENYDDVRKFLIHEPRGHKDMFGAIITPPTSKNSQFGMIFMDADGYLDLCGHAVIAGVSVGLETGYVSVEDEIFVDTPAGQIRTKPIFDHESLIGVEIEGVKSFSYKRDYKIKLNDKEILVDIAYGGNFFAFVDEEELGVEVDQKNIPLLRDLGMQIKEKINNELDLRMPDGSKSKLDLVEILGKASNTDARCKNVLIYGDGQIGRDPCATGLCAKMSIEHEKGQLTLNEKYTYEGILETLYTGHIASIEKEKNGKKEYIRPIIRGRTFIVGYSQFVLDKNDPISDWLL